MNAFKAANDVLRGAVQGIAELITRPGLINVDFADVRTVMSEMGMAMMGTGVASGENRARLAAESAIASPLLEDVDMNGARGVLVNITAGMDMSIGEFEEVGEAVKSITSERATVVVGTVIDPELRDEIRVTVIVTGLGRKQLPPARISDPVSTSTTRVDGSFDYHSLEKPAVMRKTGVAAHTVASIPPVVPSQGLQKPSNPNNPNNLNNLNNLNSLNNSSTGSNQEFDYLDIPAFLRRKEEVTE